VELDRQEADMVEISVREIRTKLLNKDQVCAEMTSMAIFWTNIPMPSSVAQIKLLC
jgi:hypothetical protein